MPFRAIVSALLLPPTSLVLLALVGLLIEWRWRRAGRFLLWVSILALLILGLPVVGDTMLVALERNLPLTPPKDAPPQAIVVLGGDLSRSGLDEIIFRPGQLSLERLRAAAALYRQDKLPILITGGVLQKEDEQPLATVMAKSMEDDFQVPVRWTENASLNTWENAQFTAAILHKEGITSIYVVSQAWHIRRALIAFANTGITVTAAPTQLDRPPQYKLTDFLPDLSGWRTSYFALHEWIGCAYYSLL